MSGPVVNMFQRAVAQGKGSVVLRCYEKLRQHGWRYEELYQLAAREFPALTRAEWDAQLLSWEEELPQ